MLNSIELRKEDSSSTNHNTFELILGGDGGGGVWGSVWRGLNNIIWGVEYINRYHTAVHINQKV